MKSWKAIMALLLCACMLFAMLAACAKQETPAPTNEPTNSNTEKDPEPAKTDDKQDEPAKTEEPEQQPEPEAPTEVIFWISDVYAHGADHLDRLTAAINAITEPNGVTVKPNFMNIGEWISKVQTSLISGEQVDLMCYSAGSGITSMVMRNMAMDITDELNEYAPETLDLMANYMGATTYNGRIYGVPTLRSYVTNGYFSFNQEMLDEAGLTELAKTMTTWSEFEQILQGLYDNFSAQGCYPIAASLGAMLAGTGYYIHGDKFADIENVDTLGAGAGVVYTDTEGNVSLAQAKEEYKQACITAKEWLDKGWLHPDGVYDNQFRADDAIASRVAACEICPSELGVEATKTMRYGAQALCVKERPGMIMTSTLTAWGIGVPITSEEPEAACKLINMLYTNEDLMRIFVNGIEGEDYEIVDNVAQQKEGMYSNGNFILGNNLLAIPLVGNDPDMYEQIKAENDAAQLSPYLGFTLDNSELELLTSQLTAVTDQYSCYMSCGAYSDADYAEYLDKLNAAGVQEYLDAVQAQLTAWLANH